MPSVITNISIENIKGYGSPTVTLPLELKTNRINLIFAPNGTGKSSMAAAFRSLEGRTLKVEKENKFHKDESLQSKLSIQLDGTTFEADANNNTISPNLSCHVINCATAVHTTQRNMGHFTSVSGYIDIQDILIEPVVSPTSTGYSITQIRSEFGANGKVLDNLQQIFQNPPFLLKTKKVWSQLDFFGRAKSRTSLIDEILTEIHHLGGNSAQVFNNIDSDWLVKIEANETYSEITSILDEIFPSETRIERFLRFFQLYTHWNKNKTSIKAATARVEYEIRKRKYDENIALLDSTWKNIHTEEVGGNLIVKFPQADEISNGQRDLLTFIVSILKFKIQLRDNKKYLLLIDEVFDYLDDANLIAAQYYLTMFLDISKDNLFLCLLSHLNPFTFRSYVFSDKKINIQYLKETLPKATLPMMSFITFRERMHAESKVGDRAKADLYYRLSHDLFHYNPTVVDYSSNLATYRNANEQHLNNQWGKTNILHQFLIEEVNKYLSDQPAYDPYAVALALRLRVEKLMYDNLPDPLKQNFVDTPMTKKKFDYCIQNGIEVPDVFYIVTAIHNEADHLKFDVVNNRFIEKPMVYKLQNNAVTVILKNIFGWHGAPLDTSVID